MNILKKVLKDMNYIGMAIYSIIMSVILLPTAIYIVEIKPNFFTTFIILLVISSVSCSIERLTKANEKKGGKK